MRHPPSSAATNVAGAGSLAFAVMAKAPQPGRVKTRLTPPLTPDQALVLSEAFLVDTLAAIRHAARDTPIMPYIAYMPAGSERQLRGIAGRGIALVLADGGPIRESGVTGMGRSLLHATRALLERRHAGMCLISADSPTLPPTILREAAAALTRPGERMVLGVAEDGGYYLIGLQRAYPALFQDIDWSTPAVAAQTQARAAAIGLECVLLPPWHDIDDQASLTRLITALASGAEQAPRTAAALRSFGLLEP